AHLYLTFPTERNGIQSTERNQTKRKFAFRLVRFEVTVGRFPQNCSYPLRPKIDFQAERFKPLMIYFFLFRSVGKPKYK
uniref:Ovule protein n=1 Tax=Romanomermis culicivorax TaxID=13658 RepID=A0A915KCQ2_ROMCU